MGRKFKAIESKHRQFIEEQKIFFVATTPPEGRINLSPKGMDSFRVINQNKIVWLNLTGSGNETAAHLLEDSRMTIMFCAFEGKPLILRLYGQAKTIHQKEEDWNQYISLFPAIPGIRQLIEMEVDLVHTSCGMGVPLLDFQGDRTALIHYAEKKGKEGLRNYWKEKNTHSMDGKPTFIVEKNG